MIFDEIMSTLIETDHVCLFIFTPEKPVSGYMYAFNLKRLYLDFSSPFCRFKYTKIVNKNPHLKNVPTKSRQKKLPTYPPPPLLRHFWEQIDSLQLFFHRFKGFYRVVKTYTFSPMFADRGSTPHLAFRTCPQKV